MEFAIKKTETTGNTHSDTFLVEGDDALKALKNLMEIKYFQDYYSQTIGNLTIEITHLSENFTTQRTEAKK